MQQKINHNVLTKSIVCSVFFRFKLGSQETLKGNLTGTHMKDLKLAVTVLNGQLNYGAFSDGRTTTQIYSM